MMRLRLSVCLMLCLLLSAPLATRSAAQFTPLPEKSPTIEAKKSPAADKAEEEEEEDDDDEDEDGKDEKDEKDEKADKDKKEEEARKAKSAETARQAQEGEDEEDTDESAGEDGVDGMPPMPTRAPPLSQRSVKTASEPLGPAPPPQSWSAAEISEAKAQCETLLKDTGFTFEALEPIREGACGAPAPIRLKYFNDRSQNDSPRIELRPAAVITCPLAAALDKWIRDYVQPLAKTLLHADVIRLGNMSGYQCRTRYGNPSQRMSYHAYAEALDVGEFLTAKGERIVLLEHWSVDDERSRFLKEIHAGACKVFGTVLGPEANAAHHNHFHFDVAKRRHSSYCQ